ncbi:MAG: glycoside hydrolase [bacterium]
MNYTPALLTALLLAALATLHTADAAVISNAVLRVEFSDTDGALAITDLRTRHTWWQALVEDMPDHRQQLVTTDSSQRTLTLDCGLAGLTHDGKKAVAPFRLSVKLHTTRPDVEVTFAFAGNGQWRQAAYPYAFARDGAEVYNLYPHSEGMLVPVRRNHPDWLELPDHDFYGGVHSYLMCLGLVDLATGEGLLTLLPDIESTGKAWREVNGLVLQQIVWTPNKGNFDQSYHVTWSFSSTGGYVALSQRYRQFFAEAGLHRTLREKAEENPGVKNLAGASIFWAIAHSPAETKAMADCLKSNSIDRCLFALGSQVPMSKREDLADAIKHIRALGYEVYRYDNYRDAFRKDGHVHQNNTEAWPDMIVRRENGAMVQAFGTNSGVVCSQFFLPLARQNFDREFRDFDYSARFVDCLGSCGFGEGVCYDPRHPSSTADVRRERIALLSELNRRGKLAGTECSVDYLLPYLHWVEGATSLVCWRETLTPGADAVIRDINSQSDTKAAAKERYHELNKLPLDAPAPDTISLSTKYRIPFYSLCHHDEVIVTWRWEDGMDQPPPHWRRKMLWSVLYGAPPMYRMYAAGVTKWQKQIGKTQRDVSDWVRQIAFDEMLDHKFLTADRSVQQTIFSSGRGVIVNFGAMPYTIAGGSALPGGAYVTFTLDASGSRNYSQPVIPLQP